MMEKKLFRIIFSSEAQAFMKSIPADSADKIIYNVRRVMFGERNTELFKKLENTDIWEFRTLYNNTAYRLLAFWDKKAETLVVATHGFIKKTQKTPSREIAKAEAIRKEWFKNK